MNSDDIRQLFVNAALAVVGLGDDPNDQDKRQQYRDFIAPGESPERQQVMAKMSSCGLVVAGIWRSAGVDHPILSNPYVTGSAISRLTEIGREAWVPHQLGKFPQPGDAVRIGDNTALNGAEHMFTVTQIVGGTAPILRSVDGGQRDPALGFEMIMEKRRAWMHGRDTATGGAGSRAVMGWFDAELLATLIPN